MGDSSETGDRSSGGSYGEEPQVLTVGPAHIRALTLLNGALMLLLLLGIVGALFLMNTVVPLLVSLFEGMNLVLPFPTKLLIAFTKFLRNPVGMVMGGGMVFAALAALIIAPFLLAVKARKDFLASLLLSLIGFTVVMSVTFLAVLCVQAAILLPFLQLMGTLH